MSIQALIWDIGGVIVRTEDRNPRTALAEEFGMTYEEMDSFVFGRESARRASVGQLSEGDHWQDVLKALNLPPEKLDAFRERFWGGDRVDYDLINYIQQLRPHYQTAVLSNAWDEIRLAIETKWGIHQAFDRFFISAELGMVKPDPRIYQRVLNELKVLPEEAVFVDDFIENVTAARQAGLHAIQFKNTRQVRVDLDSLLAEHGRLP